MSRPMPATPSTVPAESYSGPPVRIFSIGSAYGARKIKKTAWVGAFLIITWCWIGTLALYLVDGFTITLMPGLSSVAGRCLDSWKYLSQIQDCGYCSP